MHETPPNDDVIHNLRVLFEDHGAVLTPREIANVLGYSEATIINWLNEGTLLGFRLGRTWRITKNDFLEGMVARSSLVLAHEDGDTQEL